MLESQPPSPTLSSLVYWKVRRECPCQYYEHMMILLYQNLIFLQLLQDLRVDTNTFKEILPRFANSDLIKREFMGHGF